MSRLREPLRPRPAPSRALGRGKLLVAGPTGRFELTTAAAAPPRGLGISADPAALARDVVEGGRLNWPGPATHAVLVSVQGDLMDAPTARRAVDFAFSTPRPGLTVELVDEDGEGWRTARFCVEYALRRAEWAGRGLALVYRASKRPEAEREAFLRSRGAVVRASFALEGAPAPGAVFPARRARAVVRRGARAPAAWADALADMGVEGVEWVCAPELSRDAAGSRSFAAFAAGALERLLERESGPRDELALALLAARPWEIPGTDLVECMAYAPDGSVYSSEEGWALASDGETKAFRLGRLGSLRFSDFPSLPAVPALASALAGELQPLCAACVYAPLCAVPPSAHWRAHGSLYGRLPDSPRCAAHMALLDAVFGHWGSEKRMKALEKWGVDIARLTC